MSKENNIKRGLLSEKMSKFSVEPPEGAWGNISSQLGGGNSRKYFFIALAAAAGLALAITLGVTLIEWSPEQEIAETDLKESAPKSDIKVIESEERNSTEFQEESKVNTPLQTNELTAQKTVSPNETRTNRKNRDEVELMTKGSKGSKPSKLEEKVLVAMEEVIDEMETEQVIYITENVAVESDGIDTAGESDPIDVAGLDEKIAAQAKIDSIASQHYLDSLTNIAKLDDEIIPGVIDDKSKWQIGASLSPIFSYRDASSPDILQNQVVNNSERGRLSYSGGLRLSYLSSDRLSIESGVYYNRMGLAIGDFTRFESELDFLVGAKTFSDNSIVSLSNSIGTIDTKNEDVFVNAYAGAAPDSWNRLESTDMESSAMVLQDEEVNSFEQSLEYLEIPFNLKYKVINRDFKVLLIGGVSTNLLIGNKVTANTSDGKIDYGSVQDIKTVNYSGNAGLGFIYSFTGNLSLSVEPRFRYFLNSVNQASLPATRPYVLGLYTGVNYTF